jgi:uncharacterized protein (DUF4415 family)
MGYNFGAPRKSSGEKSMSKIVRKRPAGPISQAERRRLEKLAQMADSEIDFSDIPELTEKFWRNAVRNRFCRQPKKRLTLWIDVNVIEWLRKKGKGYHARANAVLRDAMLRDLREKAS